MLEKDYIIKKGLSAYRKLVDNNFVFPPCSACEELLNKSFGVVNTAAIDSFLKSDYCLLGDEYICLLYTSVFLMGKWILISLLPITALMYLFGRKE